MKVLEYGMGKNGHKYKYKRKCNFFLESDSDK